MSFISGFFLGGGFLSSPTIPIASTEYSNIRVNGACTVDKVRVLNIYLTDVQLDELDITDEYTWDQNTLLYAEFSNNLNAGNLSTNEPVTGWKLLRVKSGDILSKEIADDLDADVNGYYDYRTVNGDTYYYSVYAKTANSILSPLTTAAIECVYDDTIIVDEATGEYYIFSLNTEWGDISTVDDQTIYESGNSKYPVISQGKKQYRKGSLQALMGYMSCNDYIDTVSYSDDFETFICNGNIKVIKNSIGRIMRIKTSSFSMTPELFAGNIQRTAMSFSWTEIGAI